MRYLLFLALIIIMTACQPDSSRSLTPTPEVATRPAQMAEPDVITPSLATRISSPSTALAISASQTVGLAQSTPIGAPILPSTEVAIVSPGSTTTIGPFDPLFESVTRTVDAVDVQGQIAYLSVGPILATLDVTDRHVPRLLGAVKLPVEAIFNITTSAGYAYVTSASDLWVVDVSNPAQLREVGLYSPPQGINVAAVSQAAGQAYAYLPTQDAGLRVINISDRARPVEVGVFTPSEGVVKDVSIAQSRAYVANSATGQVAQIIDISNPAQPQLVDVALPNLESGTVNAIALPADQTSSRYLYAAAGSCQNWGNDRFCGGMLRVIDVAQPTAPPIYLPLGFAGVSANLAVSHGYAYLLTLTGLQVVDVSDPTQPQVKSVLPLNWAKDITVEGDTLYVSVEICSGRCQPGTSRDGSLLLFDLADPANPKLMGLWQLPGQVTLNSVAEPTVGPEPTEESESNQ